MSATASRFDVQIGSSGTRALFEPAVSDRLDALFVLAHGAGGHMEHHHMTELAGEFRARGFDVLRFDFLYRARGRGAPDRMPKLMECYAAVVERARSELSPSRLVIGGQSMGGRTSTMLAADGFECDGLLLCAYPLHAPRRTDKLRAEHLASIERPVLCLNGTRDTLCDRTAMDGVVSGLPATWTMHWLEHADHSFRVPKRSGRTAEEVLGEVGKTARTWASDTL